jgi:hypothetical protein
MITRRAWKNEMPMHLFSFIFGMRPHSISAKAMFCFGPKADMGTNFDLKTPKKFECSRPRIEFTQSGRVAFVPEWLEYVYGRYAAFLEMRAVRLCTVSLCTP